MTFKEQTGLQLLDQCCRNIIQFFVTFSLAMSYSCFRRSNGIARIMLETWYATVFWWFWGLETCKSRELGGTLWEESCCLLSLLYTFPRIFHDRLASNTNFWSDLLWLSYSAKGFESSTPQVDSPSIAQLVAILDAIRFS